MFFTGGCAGVKAIPVRLYRVVFETKKAGLADAQLLDTAGNVVKVFWKGKAVASGALTLIWDGRDDKGETAAPGAYQAVLSIRRWDLLPVGNFGGLGSTTGRFLNPQGLCAYPQGARLTVAVADTGNQRIQILTDTGGFLQAAGEFGGGNEKLNQPTDVDWDGQILTVCDSQNHRLARFDDQGIYLGEVRQLTGLQTTSARSQAFLGFEEPRSIKKGGGATYWVSDPGKGTLVLLTGTGGVLQLLGDPFPLGNEGPFFELGGNLFIQMGLDNLQMLDANGNSVKKVKADPPFEAIAGMTASEDFGVISDSQQGLLYLIDKDGGVFEALTPEGVSKPGALSLWQDRLFVIDSDQSKLFHYRLAPAPVSSLQQKITVTTAPGLDAQ